MRDIEAALITEAVKKITMEAGVRLEPDILEGLVSARDSETSGLAKNILELLLVNADIAAREKIPVCQDTGVAVVFIELGQDVHINGDLGEAVQQGIQAGYQEGYLRKSVCDPITRVNTGTNTPAVIHIELVPGEQIRISVLPKGCGSENMSGLTMLPPSSGISGMKDFVVRQVVNAGPNPCPPLLIGVGMGGTFEKAALLAKKALIRPLGKHHSRPDVAALEEEILTRINEQGQGVQGLGGNNTALAVHIDLFPSHIASLPVAVNIQCHAHRHKEIVL
ncbi:MAG: fumarate hydratase [Desulfobulbaceae bacterium]|nr:fumarate hydratase [Pseudomonadota bacterium]MCG2746699.1 fumarate hydratase [Desulfobulbaceae bacterium]